MILSSQNLRVIIDCHMFVTYINF